MEKNKAICFAILFFVGNPVVTEVLVSLDLSYGGMLLLGAHLMLAAGLFIAIGHPSSLKGLGWLGAVCCLYTLINTLVPGGSGVGAVTRFLELNVNLLVAFTFWAVALPKRFLLLQYAVVLVITAIGIYVSLP